MASLQATRIAGEGFMARRYIQEYRDGDSIDEIFLLADKQLRANRNANLYLLATLRDKSGQMNGLMWNVTEDSTTHIRAGEFVRVRGKVQLYQGSLQMILTEVRPVPPDGLDPEDFHPGAAVDVDSLLPRLKQFLLSVEPPALRTLMECFLIDDAFMHALCRAPAGVRAHHAYHGGLLEHVVNMLEVAHRIADLYPSLDIDLLLAGIFLHDIGKVRELGYDTALVYTDEGQLIGHLMIGVEMLDEKIAEAERLSGEPFPTETALRLKHMIVSHHGRPEYGAVKVPMTPEAIALHHLDSLDAKVHEFTRFIEDDPNAGSPWTPYLTRLDRKLYKGEPAVTDDAG
jgi:3'-5' exoribonuclease